MDLRYPRAGSRSSGTPASEANEWTPQATQLCRVISEFHSRGLCLGTSGNFSVVVNRDPFRLLITPSGLDKGRLDPDDLVAVGPDGRPVSEGSRPASAETILHCTIAVLGNAGSVLHVHSVRDTLLGEHFVSEGGFAITGYEMLKGLAGVRGHEARVFVPVLPNSQDMEAVAREVRQLLERDRQLPGFLLAGHGLYTWGDTLDQAKTHVEVLEFLFECLAARTHFRPFAG